MAKATHHVPSEGLQATIDKNRNLLIGGLVVVILVVVFFLFRGWQSTQHERTAAPLMAAPQQYFEADSFSRALYGDGLNPGFLEIIDNYGRAKSAGLARYYAGVCFLQLGDVPNAISFLKESSTGSSSLTARKYQLLGHAYAEANDMAEASRYYEKAAETADDQLFTPFYLMEAGDFFVAQGDYARALTFYQRIRDEYPKSQEAQDIDRYIYFAEAKLKK